VEAGFKLIKHQGGEVLCEDVSELRCRWNMEDVDLTDGDILSDKMEINLHVLGVLVEEQPVWMALDGDVEEVMKRLEVLHSNLAL
jgi:hypothetical protein